MIELEKKIGVVAIGRNEGDRLKSCLNSIPGNIPTVYVDSASTDDSVAFARSVGASVVQLDMAVPFTAARARNEGWQELLRIYPDIKYIQFVDGDCELEDDWLRSGSVFLSKNGSIAAVCGRRQERYPDASLYNRMCDDEWTTPIGEANACGGDAIVRTTALFQVQGYDSALIAGEEPELCQRLRGSGWHIWRLDEPMTIHDADMHSLAQWWKRAVRSGFGYAQVYWKTKASGRDKLYFREIISALFWTFGIVMSAIFLSVFLGPEWLAIAPSIWLIQFARLASREGFMKGAYVLLAKIPETIGVLRFAIANIRGHKQGAIFYK